MLLYIAVRSHLLDNMITSVAYITKAKFKPMILTTSECAMDALDGSYHVLEHVRILIHFIAIQFNNLFE